jgi:hypothetical protein
MYDQFGDLSSASLLSTNSPRGCRTGGIHEKKRYGEKGMEEERWEKRDIPSDHSMN